MTVVDALWRIAELASRSADPKWPGDRMQAMADLEAAIQEFGTRLTDCAAGLERARAEADEAEAQARAARGELDGERSRAAHWEARATEAHEALADRADDLRALRRAHHEIGMTRAALAGVEAERDEALSALAAAHTALAEAGAALAAARAEATEAEARRLAAQKARRMAEAERDAAVGVLNRQPAPPMDLEVDLRASQGEENQGEENIVEMRRGPETGSGRLLHVVATLGHLLPEDLSSLLVPQARVIRREGRLAALIALPVAGDQRGPSDEVQADRFRAEGFRVEWAEGDCLAS